MNKKANGILISLIVGLIGLFFIYVVFTAFTPAFETVRDSMNSSFTSTQELRVSSHINRTWGWSFVILGFSIIIYMIISALTRQSKEYYR